MKTLLAQALIFGAAIIPSTYGSTYYSALKRCPLSCQVTGPDQSGWTYYHSLDAFQTCDQPVLFDLALYNPVEANDVALRACTATNLTLPVAPEVSDLKNELVDVRFMSSHSPSASGGNGIVTAAKLLQNFVISTEQSTPSIILAKSGNAVVGLYAGSQVEKRSAGDIVGEFVDRVKDSDAHSQQLSAQVCPDRPISSQIFGIFAQSDGSVSAVQNALKAWNDAQCVNIDGVEDSSEHSIGIVSAIQNDAGVGIEKRGISHLGRHWTHHLIKRKTCKYVKADHGDGCWALANKCGISQANLKRFNKDGLCTSLKYGQHVCCSSGSLPDFSPQPNDDGSCASYTISSGDICAAIANSHYMDVSEIRSVNKHTWGWAGCSHLQIGQVICLSTGKPPMPAPMSNAICGPQVPGTERPTDGTDLADLNPCPLNACCDIWGQCGITREFCTRSPADTGSPGTAKPGTNGCISNCGTEITNTGDGPVSFARVGYFEAWNLDRPCLHMDVSKMTASGYYTHVHFAFASITNDYQVDVSAVQDQFNGLLKLEGIKRILSFGGWGFSTAQDTFPIFRRGVAKANRDAFANAVVGFAIENDLDGLDFDWEYPGAPDIPGIPAGDPGDGDRYLDFLKIVRSRLPSDKTLSIAAPASYWYLKGFPIKKISEVVDYIIYMTYDLHGQWDYGNKFSSPGCPTGNCLRSQVNMTETRLAIAMITKAGVPTNKLMGGLPLYGRSFEMSEVGCTGPSCHFTATGADPGPCTQTSGYISNYEITQVLKRSQYPTLYGNIPIEQYHDEGSVLVYDKNQWVSYLTPDAYDDRSEWLEGLNFAGTSDWAADLETAYADNGTGESYSNSDGLSTDPLCDNGLHFDTLDDLQAHSGSLPRPCAGMYALDTLGKMLHKAYANYTDVNNGYDKKFDAYVRYVKHMIPSALDSFMLEAPGNGFQYFDCIIRRSPGDPGISNPCKKLSDATLHSGTFTMELSLRKADKKAFYTSLTKITGIPPDWIAFTGQREWEYGCSTGGCPLNAGDRTWTHYPTRADDIDVPNPKDTVSKGLRSIRDVRVKLEATWADIMLGTWHGSFSDAAQVMSVPVFMLEQAVDSMAQVKVLGEKELELEADARRNLILEIIGAVLFVVPFLGEAGAAAAGAATLARVAAIAGEAANGAFTIYSLVEDPSSALMSLMGMMVGAGGAVRAARDATGFAKMAKVRRGMTAAEVSKMGKIFSHHDSKLQDILKNCN